MHFILLLDRELGKYAVWSLSTAKPGNGIEELRDNSSETFWQSDGTQPHIVNIQFIKKVLISKVCLYLDYGSDESYTPKKIAFKSGTTLHDLTDITAIEMHEPVGWVSVSLTDSEDGKNGGPLKTHFLQIRIISMHQNGRDTHIRQLKVLGPRVSPSLMANTKLDSFKTPEMQQFAVLR